MADPLGELADQVERGTLFTHTALGDAAERANETDALLNGLVDVLINGGVVNADELRRAVEAVREETVATGQAANAGVALRVDGPSAEPDAPVDCAARLPICRAVCCRLPFALSADEVESGPVRWDLGRPYRNRRRPDGYCVHCDADTLACDVYDRRPGVCRRYDCTHDARIWSDFEAMKLNQEWIDAHVGGDRPSPVEIYMDAVT